MRNAIAALAVLAGCFDASTQICGDLICSGDAVCRTLAVGTPGERDICVSPGAVDACANAEDGTLCTDSLVDGSCLENVCVPSTCGDNVVTGREQCDGSTTLTCGDFLFYSGETTCSASCLVDTSGCSNFCGDGQIQPEFGEACDGGPPSYTCVDRGNDYGHIACGPACRDTAAKACGSFAPALQFAPGVQIADAISVHGTQVYALGDGGLNIVDGATNAYFELTVYALAAKQDTIFFGVGKKIKKIISGGVIADVVTLDVMDSLSVTALAVAPSGELWALTNDCKVRVETSTGDWIHRDLPGPASCPDPHGLVIDGSGTAYALVGSRGHASVDRWTGQAWVVTDIDGTSVMANNLNRGTNGRAIAATSNGIYDLTTDKVHSSGGWKDAVMIGDQFLGVANAGNAFFLARDKINIALGPWTTAGLGGGREVRLMPDGSVLLLGNKVASVDPRTISDPATLAGLVGARPAGDGFVLWSHTNPSWTVSLTTNDQQPTKTIDTIPSAINDVAVASDGTIYVATALGLRESDIDDDVPVWTLPMGGDGVVASVMVGAGGDAAIISTAASTTTVKISHGGAFTQGLSGYPAGTPIALAGRSLTDVYLLLSTTTAITIQHFDGTGWTEEMSLDPVAAGDVKRFVQLGDGSVALATKNEIHIGSGTTWTTVDMGAISIDGAAADDMYIATATGLKHWNGTDVAPVRLDALPTTTYLAANGNVTLLVGRQGPPGMGGIGSGNADTFLHLVHFDLP